MNVLFRHPLNSDATVDNCLLTQVFIDYESLFFSIKNTYQVAPDLKALVDDLMEMGQLKSIKAFGDFSQPLLSAERNRIRTITSHIYDCGAETGSKKDVTDFIMLDHIYQTLIEDDGVQQYILITGDGHFASVATFMRVLKGKVVGVYGVPQTLSRQLQQCASWTRYIEVEEPEYQDYVEYIAANLRSVEQRGKIATFRKTCEIIQRTYGGDYELCQRHLRQMIAEGLVLQEPVTRFSDDIGEYTVQRLLMNEEKWAVVKQ